MPKKARKSAQKEKDNRTTNQRMHAFLACYADTCNIVLAAKHAGIGRNAHYKWLDKDEKYAAAFHKSRREAGEFLEAEAVRRASEGWLEPIHYQGNECGTVRRYDGGLMQFLLRGFMPEKYGTQRQEISGPQGAPMQARIEVVFVKPGDTGTDR